MTNLNATFDTNLFDGQDEETANSNATFLATPNHWQNVSLYYSIPTDAEDLKDCKPFILKAEIKDFMEWKWWIGGVVMSTVAIFGLCANLMSIAVLVRPKIRETAFNQLLAILCIVDTFFISCNSLSCMHALGITNNTLKVIRAWLDTFAQVSMCASVLMIVALTFERHFAIRSPHRYRIHIRTTEWWKHLAYYVVPVTVLSIIFNIPMFINLQRSWMKNTTYLKVNLYLRMLHPLTTTGVAPILVLIILNVRITRGIMNLQAKSRSLFNRGGSTCAENTENPSRLQSIRNHQRTSRSQQQNRREIRMAYVTFAIVALFFFLNMPRMLLGGYEVSNTWLILHCVENGTEYLSTLTFYRWDTVSRLLMVANSSINFLIYCTGSQQFKEEFLDMFLPNCLSKLRNRPDTNDQLISAPNPQNEQNVANTEVVALDKLDTSSAGFHKKSIVIRATVTNNVRSEEIV